MTLMHRAALASAIMFLCTAICAFAAPLPTSRRVVSLDGRWQITQGALTDEIPKTFDRSIPVPGLVDMARPSFTEVGVPSQQRQAFWYRHTFTVAGSWSPVAILKINKAMFGTKVWLNGQPIGEHYGCFTPGYFDVSRVLRYSGARNTLVVRIGCKDSAPTWLPTGTDYEKTIWQPGIYDSVSLILTDSTRIDSVQVAPHVGKGTATIQVVLANHRDRSMQTKLTVSVREWRNGHPAAKPISQQVSITPLGRLTAAATIRLDKPHLWSPEAPFLYVVRCQAGKDAVETRIGMREFAYDPKTGRAILNGKPYYLRGSNFCMFRFFEDLLRGGLPWDHKWARKLLTQPKNLLHWNSARVCIAPFPEFWYDIADETGWLLQDEYPIWGFNDQWRQAELETEFKEWLQERWNHPSIAVWDACNETLTQRTGDLIKAVRGLDLSNRPWDDGYSPRHRPTDAVEFHGYTILPPRNGEDPRLSTALDKTWPGIISPIIINEYDAFWMARDGDGTVPFKQWYMDKLGPNATLNQKEELLAYSAAAVSEYWRARRDAAGVHWFCYLSYSKPNMVTSDNFSDIRTGTIEPHFLDYMRNAFSPLAVMLDDVQPQYAPGTTNDFRVIITNDLYKPQWGVIDLKLTSGSKIVDVQSAPFIVKALGQSVTKLSMTLPKTPGRYRLAAELIPDTGEHVKSRRNIQIVTADEALRLMSLSDNCPVTASSSYPGCPAKLAVDRRSSTRWSSQFSDPQWIMVDLGRPRTISRVVVDWETAYGKAYRIQVSMDKKTWTDVYTTDQGKGGREEIAFPPAEARYVRLYGTARGTEWGYSLWSFQVFGK